MTGHLAFLDLETTGLDEHTCSPLEVACIVTTRELEERGRYAAVVQLAADAHWDAAARELHERQTANGVSLAELAQSGRPWEVVARELAAFLAPYAGELFLAGNTCHFDRRWLERLVPELMRIFHHRHYDVSGLFLWAEQFGIERVRLDRHRAMDDLEHCLAELRRLHRSLADLMAEKHGKRT